MRINKYVARATGLSRRDVDAAISQDRVSINGQLASLGDQVADEDQVKLDDQPLTASQTTTIMLNKPAGYVCSRDGQGSQTIYDLLPVQYQQLKPVGRLDKDSTGLLLLTNDGDLANRLTHPSYGKTKIYSVSLNKPLEPLHQQIINDRGVQLEDGISQLSLEKLNTEATAWRVTMAEGRNRQIRRTFAALGYEVTGLKRQAFGDYSLGRLKPGQYKPVQ